jgi:glycerophosphoryl diester phosphodiesterase
MKIIGHRGAAGLAPENSLKAIKAAKALDLDGIEIDIRITKDGQLILSHDAKLNRLAGKSMTISKHNLSDLIKIKLKSGEYLFSLKEVIEAVEDAPLVIDAKDNDWAEPLKNLLENYKYRRTLRVISFNHMELSKFKILCPDIEVYALSFFNIFSAIASAKKYKFEGIDVSYIGLTVAGYYIAKWLRLKIIVYGVNSKTAAKIISTFFPGTAITTDNPHLLKPLIKEIGE